MTVPPRVPQTPERGARERVRCSALAEARGEPLAGTAPTITAVLLLEERGPWGDKAWRDARLPDGLGAEIVARCAESGIRPLLMRRATAGAPNVDGRRLVVASTRVDRPWMEEAVLRDPREILDLDLAALGAGRALGLTPRPEPLLAVCIHGGHDACCADRGRPALEAFAAVEPEAAWGVSHLGGHRFAATALVLGDGLSYGRLDAESARLVAAEHRAGRVVLRHLRGRVGWPAPVQAAEIAVRRQAGVLDRAPGLRLVDVTEPGPDGGPIVVRFAVDRAVPTEAAHDTTGVAGSAVWRVRVASRRRDPAQMSCSATVLEPATQWDVIDVATERP